MKEQTKEVVGERLEVFEEVKTNAIQKLEKIELKPRKLEYKEFKKNLI